MAFSRFAKVPYLAVNLWYKMVGNPVLATLRYIIFGQTQGIKWTVPSDSLAKKKQLSFYEGLRPIAASIKEGLLLLRSTIVLVQK